MKEHKWKSILFWSTGTKPCGDQPLAFSLLLREFSSLQTLQHSASSQTLENNTDKKYVMLVYYWDPVECYGLIWFFSLFIYTLYQGQTERHWIAGWCSETPSAQGIMHSAKITLSLHNREIQMEIIRPAGACLYRHFRRKYFSWNESWVWDE